MRHKRYLILSLLLAIVLILVGSLFLLHNSDKDSSNTNQFKTLTSENSQVTALDYTDLSINSYSDVYNVTTQQSISEQIEVLKTDADYDFSNILAISNPYQTNVTSLYVYFKTDKASKISYTISDLKGSYPTYSVNSYNNLGDYSTIHEYQIIGFVGGIENKLTLTATTENGEEQTTTISYTPPTVFSNDEQNNFTVSEGASDEALSNGLYAVIGDQSTSQKLTYLVDNDGIVRAELPLIGYNSLRLLFDEQQNMYLTISKSKIAKINRLGAVLQIYDVGASGYNLHHDFTFDDQGNIIALATNLAAETDDKLVEDRIIKINRETASVSEVADFRKLLPELYDVATELATQATYEGYWDPIHLNTIQYSGDDSIIVSSRETSTIIKLGQISDNPTIDYFISDASVWTGIGDYANYLLSKDGDFVSQAGQHSVIYQTDNSLAEGQYYLYLFNNNSGIMDSRPNFDFSAYENIGSDDKTDSNSYSMYYKYLVDENKRTYQLVESFKVPYSPYISSVQNFSGNLIIDSGQQGIFSEYDASNELIRSFTINSDTKFIYRVYKYDFENYYFSSD